MKVLVKKVITICACMFLCSTYVFAQDSLFFRVQFGLGTSKLRVIDHDIRPSSESIAADGHTIAESQEAYMGFKFLADYRLIDPLFVSTGVWFSNKGFRVRNTDGSYTGVSHYTVSHMQIPFLLSFISEPNNANLSWFAGIGATLGIKTAESLHGSDGAHFWNLANNLQHLDSERGVNGNGTAIPLFAPFHTSLQCNAGAFFQLSERFSFIIHFGYERGLINLINQRLLFRDGSYVYENLEMYVDAFSIDFGLWFSIDKEM